jgi:hypothetical protein
VLTGGGLLGRKIVVDPGAVQQVAADEEDAVGYLVESSMPLTVAWSVEGPSGIAFSAASPVLDE